MEMLNINSFEFKSIISLHEELISGLIVFTVKWSRVTLSLIPGINKKQQQQQ